MSDALAAKMTPVVPFRALSKAGASIRTDTRIADDTFIRTTGGGYFNVIGVAEGDTYEGSSEWYIFRDRTTPGLHCIHSKTCSVVGTAGVL